MKVLAWHVHGSWMDAFVRGRHTYVLPVRPEGGPWGLGRADRPWPDNVVEADEAELADSELDLVVLQRPEEIERAERLLGRRPGRDVPAVFVEHNTPLGGVPDTRHPLADQSEIPIVHVTHFNQLIWDSGQAPVMVIPHGVPDPGEQYTGATERAAVVINEPRRRGRRTGTDLLPAFCRAAPVDLFGMGLAGINEHTGVDGERLRPIGDLPLADLHRELATRRLYLHTARWTSLGLSLIEAMHLGMPVVALATTEAAVTVPKEAGFVATDVGALTTAIRQLIDDPGLARAAGKAAREHALAHHGLEAFLHNWDTLFGRLMA
ncbi:glycosyltransferase [Amycolatopsis sp. 195334CR]|uniref:glycosyltransferase n=1 Tax=Amycolatopsis sp. 195334CR TaxID=2814588 RepID=UPI001A8E3D31|nr:glycosyltransferase [Amycolatopsis sp. 195334CR]MBN6038379.1 glycosyltransferase [Amycolatopsis sp. 195334CR]